MKSLVSWQLMLFLCATVFRETFEKEAPMENPGLTGMHCLGGKGAVVAKEREASLLM